ncbi:UDP-N-acetylglucosamine 2-epimerase [Butyrivibrio sp. XPD2006]|uniref:UDP-N-acetylglucosamine 2-epimerase n=1 Tax=Butyrivibrio sp. XPD2006 TaxID=1280668 RepID=UPI0003B3A8C2|nr:UDP-N-acetylglucosamine 2-epimerase [Butyrivibrio sp. XPD2006]
MKKIGIITATRAEFGLLAPLIRELRNYESDEFQVELVVTGTHLSEVYGKTIDEIYSSGLRVDHEIRIRLQSKTEVDISKNQADVLVKFTELFAHEQYDGIVILGDRYEMMAVAMAAGNTRTPIFHLCGGDTTEGAMDEWIRHSISKIAYMHFVTNEESRKRVVQLGENPEHVFNYGSTSIDNILHMADMSKEEALRSIDLPDCDYALCTYHPVTMENESVDDQIEEFLNAIRNTPELEFIVTKSNADQGGARINELLDEAKEHIPNLHVFTSLGVRRYLSLMKYAKFVLGNSSSGIIETPAFHVATINIGNRQRGRLQSESIINCSPDTEAIRKAMSLALSEKHQRVCAQVVSPYGEGCAAKQIAKKIYDTVIDGSIDLKKKFFDIT